MGFTQYAIELIRNNRRLQESSRSKLFRKYSTPISKRDLRKIYYLRSKALPFKWTGRTKRYIVLTILLSLIGVIFTLGIVNEFSKTTEDVRFLNRRVIYNKEKLRRLNSKYDYWINSGITNYNKGKIKVAHWDFLMAKEFNPEGIEVNSGLSLCLLYNCHYNNVNCIKAYNQLHYLNSFEGIPMSVVKEIERLQTISNIDKS